MSNMPKRAHARGERLRKVAKSIMECIKKNKLSFANKGELKAELSINKKLERRFALISDKDDKADLVTYLWKHVKKKKKTGTSKLWLSREQSPETRSKKIQQRLMKDHKYLKTRISKELMYYNPELRFYDRTGNDHVRERAARHLNDYNLYRDKSVKEVISLISDSVMQPMSIFKLHQHRVTMLNGIYDYNTFKFDPEHRPEEYHTQGIAMNYDADAECLANRQFFDEILPKNRIKTIQEIIGWLPYREYWPKTFLVFRGETNSGRTVLIRVFERYLGDGNYSNVPLQRLSYPYMGAEMFGKFANMSDDIPLRDISDESFIKMLSGGSSIPARAIFGHPYGYISFAKQIFTTNRIPFAPKATDAFFDRAFILDFPANFPRGHPGTKNRTKHIAELTTPEELSGLFNWGIPGLKRLLKRGKFTGDDMSSVEKRINWTERAIQDIKLPTPAGPRRALAPDMHRRNRKLIWGWAEAYNWPDEWVPVRKNYKSFVKACEKRGVRAIPSETKFGTLINEHPNIKGKTMRSSKTGKHVRVRRWVDK